MTQTSAALATTGKKIDIHKWHREDEKCISPVDDRSDRFVTGIFVTASLIYHGFDYLTCDTGRAYESSFAAET